MCIYIYTQDNNNSNSNIDNNNKITMITTIIMIIIVLYSFNLYMFEIVSWSFFTCVAEIHSAARWACMQGFLLKGLPEKEVSFCISASAAKPETLRAPGETLSRYP